MVGLCLERDYMTIFWEGLGTQEEEEGEIPSSGEGLGCPYTAATKPDYHVSMADSLDAELGAHGTIVGVGLSTNGEPIHAPAAAEQTADQRAGFLVADPPIGVC